MTKSGSSRSDHLRRAAVEESDAIADLWLRSRKASFPANPAPVHDDEDVRNHFSTVVLAEMEVWVIERVGFGIVALMALSEGWIEHLHVDPALIGHGLGSRLVEVAKERSAQLDLWTFQSNHGARRFYERHGFTAVAMTDGDNEEGAPDVRYHWPSRPARSRRPSRIAAKRHRAQGTAQRAKGKGQRRARS